MFIKLVLITLFAGLYSTAELPTLYEYYTKGGIKSGLKAEGNVFHLNDKPITIFSGSLHPFRVHQNKWKETLLKFKAAGLNAVQFYTPWNLHEEIPGHFDFESGMLNLKHFLTAIKEADMFAVFRPGPYICAEYELGGFPAWLLRDPNMKLRSNYKPYLDAVDKYWSKLFAIAKDFQFTTSGGPIIAVQLENEFASYGNTNNVGDASYLKALEGMASKYGLKELFFTCDNWVTKQGSLPGLFQSINFNRNAVNNLKSQKAMNPNQPLYVSEFWSGWFDHWNGGHSRWSVDDYMKEKEGIILQMNSSVNDYMFIGGTNFGWNSGNTIVTSYDYDAPLTESGNYTEKYFKTKEIIEKFTKIHNLPQIRRPDPPKVENAAHYGVVKVTEQLLMNDFLKHVKSYNVEKPIHSELLPIGPNYGQNFGFTLYRTSIPKSTSMKFTLGHINDRAFPVVDGNEQINPYLYYSSTPITLNFDQKVFTKNGNNHTLDLLVENLGRANFGNGINSQRKWLSEDILIDNKVHKNWQMFPLDFKPDFIERVRNDKWSPVEAYKSPALFRAKLDITDEPKDTFLRLDGWHTSIVFINGFNIGRYWNNGPQKTLYIPSPLLKKGNNEIILFETFGSGNHIEFVDKPVLG